MRSLPRSWLPVVLAAGLLIGPAGSDERPEPPLTPAERKAFRATPGYDETLAYVRTLAEHWPGIDLRFFGESAAGRPLPLIVVGGDAPRDRATVLIQNGIHGGEIDGKDACLLLLRELAAGQHRDLLQAVRLLIVPIYNVDGHERVSPWNRPNQNGPVEGMGFRTTADGHDLNRDHLKLDTPEARAIVRLFRNWRPHLHVDNHVTDGVDHDWVLTYSWAEAPQLAAAPAGWMVEHMPRVLAATEAVGHRTGPYVSLLDRADPRRGFDSWVGQPRYATGYYPLRHVPSILVENHAPKPYEDRVRANHAFLLALLREVARDPGSLVSAVEAARARTVELGLPDARPSDVVLRWASAEPTDSMQLPLYEWTVEESLATGRPVVRYRAGRVRPLEIPWRHRPEARLAVLRPRGYLVLAGWPAIEQRIDAHGLRVERLAAESMLEVETLRLSSPRIAPRSNPSYQGRTQIDVEVERRTETVRFPPGTLWIPADQPDFEVAVQLLEPEADDSLVRWGALSAVLERKEYIEPRILDRLARRMLAEDERLAAEWRSALEEDAFAADASARYLWWYRRTPHWDDTVGRMPVFRVTGRPSFVLVGQAPAEPRSGP